MIPVNIPRFQAIPVPHLTSLNSHLTTGVIFNRIYFTLIINDLKHAPQYVCHLIWHSSGTDYFHAKRQINRKLFYLTPPNESSTRVYRRRQCFLLTPPQPFNPQPDLKIWHPGGNRPLPETSWVSGLWWSPVMFPVMPHETTRLLEVGAR